MEKERYHIEKQKGDSEMEYLRERIEGNSERIKVLESLTIEMAKISTILSTQQDMSSKQDNTLGKINENLTNLNHKSDRLDERVDSLEGAVKGLRESNTLDIPDLMKKVGWTVLSLLIGGVVSQILFQVFQ